MKTVRKEDWKTKEMPTETSTFDLNKKISSGEYERVKAGLCPRSMEDKWFIYFENGKIYFHRSWVGSCIYIVTAEEKNNEIEFSNVIVNRNRDQYNFTDDAEDKKLINYIIDRLLLGKETSFPISYPAIPESRNVLKMNIVGYGRANNET